MQLNFTNPELLSKSTVRDRIVLKFLQPTLFMSKTPPFKTLTLESLEEAAESSL
jgi:hypothetical protein